MTDSNSVSAALISQLQASLDTLLWCIDRCPADQWLESHGDHPFCQVAFHALFWCDYYLSGSESGFMAQAWHTEHPRLFADYEELEDRLPVRLPARDDVLGYLAFCRAKAVATLSSAEAEGLLATSSHRNGTMSTLEVIIYATRHNQHHAAQLGLRLQLLSGDEMPWFSRGQPGTSGPS
ncbi:MAG: hypothetical protein CVV51_04235 [Spirochaetae bacterium HGW-Spirochaetae-7]|jgi:hypothetical protein|nr:MAG: hypothetical protein CVV51_04235 [Spirochaetae bacterium HGW-Spirochaetae-7]